VIKDLIVQGDPEGAGMLSYGYLMPLAKSNEGISNASYTIMEPNLDPNTSGNRPLIESNINVTFDKDNGNYTIHIPTDRGVATVEAANPYEVGTKLIQIQNIALGQQ
jgi:hypothetical protein